MELRGDERGWLARRERTEKRIFFAVGVFYSSTHVTRSWINRLCGYVCMCACLVYLLHVYKFRFAIYLVCYYVDMFVAIAVDQFPLPPPSPRHSVSLWFGWPQKHIILICTDTLNFSTWIGLRTVYGVYTIEPQTKRDWIMNTAMCSCVLMCI